MEYVFWIGTVLGVVALVLAIIVFIERRREDWRDPATLAAVAVLLATFVAGGVLYAVGPEEVRGLAWRPLAVALLVVAGGAAWWRGIRWALPLVIAPIFLLTVIGVVRILWVLMDTNKRFMSVVLLGGSLAPGILGRRGRARS